MQANDVPTVRITIRPKDLIIFFPLHSGKREEEGGLENKTSKPRGMRESKQKRILELCVPYDLQTHQVIHSKGLFVFQSCDQTVTDRTPLTDRVCKKSRFPACMGVKYETEGVPVTAARVGLQNSCLQES